MYSYYTISKNKQTKDTKFFSTLQRSVIDPDNDYYIFNCFLLIKILRNDT